MKRIIPVILIVLLHLCCSSGEQAKVSEIDVEEGRDSGMRLEKVKEVEVEAVQYISWYGQEQQILAYGPVREEKSGVAFKIYFYDRELNKLREHRLYIGQGPGDVGVQGIISYVYGHFVLFDKLNFRLNRYDRDFRFVDAVRMERSGWEVPIDEAGWFTLSDENDAEKNGDLYEIYDYYLGHYDGRKVSYKKLDYKIVIKDFEAAKKKAKFCKDYLLSIFISQQMIYLVRHANYEISCYSLGGDLERVVRGRYNPVRVDEDKARKLLMKSGLNPNRFYFCEYTNPVASHVKLADGFILVRRREYLPDSVPEYVEGDYFSYNLDYLGKVKFPYFKGCLEYNTGEFTLTNVIEVGKSYYILSEGNDEKVNLH